MGSATRALAGFDATGAGLRLASGADAADWHDATAAISPSEPMRLHGLRRARPFVGWEDIIDTVGLCWLRSWSIEPTATGVRQTRAPPKIGMRTPSGNLLDHQSRAIWPGCGTGRSAA